MISTGLVALQSVNANTCRVDNETIVILVSSIIGRIYTQTDLSGSRLNTCRIEGRRSNNWIGGCLRLLRLAEVHGISEFHEHLHCIVVVLSGCTQQIYKFISTSLENFTNYFSVADNTKAREIIIIANICRDGPVNPDGIFSGQGGGSQCLNFKEIRVGGIRCRDGTGFKCFSVNDAGCSNGVAVGSSGLTAVIRKSATATVNRSNKAVIPVNVKAAEVGRVMCPG